ncbi:hypothetical protein [Puia dinghuensis]|uniref:Uncharacterized protein n=1 Tax=Puia dinghuensis TaxID=1792502 RepID=A0A8J2UEW7_9BACT|nr:hypothetical protein [Puia dinghuensis]GGB08053.1 hypothetical protein GCM10011511_34490 [Puia dinghuensis]
MSHRRIQLDYPEGSIEVQFNLEFDGSQTHINSILIHAKGGIELPQYPELKFMNGNYVLTHTYSVSKNGKDLIKEEAVQSPYGPDIVEKMLQIKEDETPKFA